MPNKRYHAKVRSGCVTCRKRRVKCGEEKPQCARCVKSGYQCEGYVKIKTWLFEPSSSAKDKPCLNIKDEPDDVKHWTHDPLILPAEHGASEDEAHYIDAYHYHNPCSFDSKTSRYHLALCDSEIAGTKSRPYSKGRQSKWTMYFDPTGAMTLPPAAFMRDSALGCQFALGSEIPRQVPSTYADGLLAHANSCFWPQLLAVVGISGAPHIISAWFEMITHSPMIFSANLYRFSKHMHMKRGKRPSREQSEQILHYQSLALKSTFIEVNRVFQEGQSPSDDLITTVLLLGLCPNLASPPPKPTTSPGESWTKNSAEGLPHLQALPILVKIKGGLDAIQTPGIADRIFWHDIIVSTFWMREPTYMKRQVPRILQRDSKVILDEEASVDEFFKLLDTFAKILDEDEWESTSDQPTFMDIYLVRMELQHYILRLPISAIRTALLLLSDLYIMPIPTYSDHRYRLSSLLRSQIIIESDKLDTNYKIWCLAAGGVGTPGSGRAWYVQNMAEWCRKENLNSMSSVKSVLSTVHWCNAAFATPSSELFWSELATAFGASPSFMRDSPPNPKRPAFLTDSYTLIQTLATEYVL